jgi:hypothetical protein
MPQSLPYPAFRLGRLKSDCAPKADTLVDRVSTEADASPSSFHIVQLPRRPDMVGTDHLSSTYEFVAHTPMVKMCGMPPWPCTIAVEWQLSHPKGAITDTKRTQRPTPLPPPPHSWTPQAHHVTAAWCPLSDAVSRRTSCIGGHAQAAALVRQ